MARGGGVLIAPESAAEAAVIRRVRDGDPEAYAQLVRAHRPVAERTALLLGAGADAEDVVQIAFLKAYQSLGRFHTGAAFRPWLLRIVANETRNTVRSRRRRQAAETREAARFAGDPVIPELSDPAVWAVAGEWRAQLLAALDRLSEDHRQVVIHRYLLELDESETAEALGWPRGTVKSRLNRALHRLRLLLSSPDPEAVLRTAEQRPSTHLSRRTRHSPSHPRSRPRRQNSPPTTPRRSSLHPPAPGRPPASKPARRPSTTPRRGRGSPSPGS